MTTADDETDTPDTPGAADPKAKFREALERKRGSQAERAAAAEAHGDSKIHGTHGAAGGKRTFRRKAGG
ncbi:MAG: DUF5302 domain-containing protein [Actinomycetota bacterium]|nr:DUF5302 domain-containing protein [Actinomycetota bacterium]